MDANHRSPSASIAACAPVLRSTITATATTSAPSRRRASTALSAGLAGGRGVLDDDDALTRDVGALDLATAAVVLGLLSHDEGVERGSGVDGLVHDGVGDRVGAQRQAADGDDAVEVLHEVEHESADRRSRAVVEGELAHVDVVRRLLAARQGEIAVEHRLGVDEADEGLAVGFELGRGGGGHGVESIAPPRGVHLRTLAGHGRDTPPRGLRATACRPRSPPSCTTRASGARK